MKSNLTIKNKCEILGKLKNGESISDLAKEYNVNRTTIYRIKINIDEIEEFASNRHAPLKKFKRIRAITVPNVDRALYSWFLNQRLNHNIVTNEVLRLKAIELHKTLDVDVPFKASSGFIEKFKKRNGIRLLQVSGEKLSSNESEIPNFIETFVEKVRQLELTSEQIYITDETCFRAFEKWKSAAKSYTFARQCNVSF